MALRRRLSCLVLPRRGSSGVGSMMIWYNVSVREKIYHISHFCRNYHIINIIMAGRYRSARAYLPAIYHRSSSRFSATFLLKETFLLKFSQISYKNLIFAKYIHPKAPKGRGWVDIYIIRRNCTLWF